MRITGTVQGVGYRPFVFGLAEELGITGWVLNDPEGVLIEAEGPRLGEFCERLRRDAPPRAVLGDVIARQMPPEGGSVFRIRESDDRSGRFTLIPPDGATCTDCLTEVLDAEDRRHRYPFTNCTHCGPRYSIVEGLPYDRPKTSMKVFVMCEACEAEYRDPRDRRFHAQPNACPACGPVLTTEDGRRGEEALRVTVDRIRSGGIVAIKGLGGFHLACDAVNAAAVAELRRRKRKSNKPFAIMARDMDAVRAIADPSPEEVRLLRSAASPIVLVKKDVSREPLLPEEICPGSPDVGVMLPYTPLHHLLFRTGTPPLNWLVMTSGNRAEEPIAATDEEAEGRLRDLAQHRLSHNRRIVMRSDDSVMRVAGGMPRFLRRARGFVPEGLPFPFRSSQVLGCGAMLKGTFTLTRDGSAVVSQHIGDLEGEAAMEFFEETLAHLTGLYRIRPDVVVHDLHPDYPSTRLARAYARKAGIAPGRVVGVQHHHAHVASVMAEHGLTCPVIGVALDGTGYGPDGTVWGGEFLVVSPERWHRAGHMRTMPLPGGEAAIREPWRAAVGVLVAVRGEEGASDLVRRMGWPERFGEKIVAGVVRLAASDVGSVQASSAGRLFDAVSAMLGLVYRNTFEGEAAIALEREAWLGAGKTGDCGFEAEIRRGDGGRLVLDWGPMIEAVIRDLSRGRSAGRIAAALHETISRAVLAVVREIAGETGISKIALSGGVFQNRMLLERVEGLLRDAGLEVYGNERVPSNDGGISLGQAYVGAGGVEHGVLAAAGSRGAKGSDHGGVS